MVFKAALPAAGTPKDVSPQQTMPVAAVTVTERSAPFTRDGDYAQSGIVIREQALRQWTTSSVGAVSVRREERSC